MANDREVTRGISAVCLESAAMVCRAVRDPARAQARDTAWVDATAVARRGDAIGSPHPSRGAGLQVAPNTRVGTQLL
jgi:hypothetical protein